MAREEDEKELRSQARSVRSAKKQARPHKMQQIAEPKAKVPVASKPKAKGSVGFEQEIMGTGKKRTVKTVVAKPKKEEVKKKEDRKLGKLKSVKGFKSKSKFKRRK